MAAPIVDYDDEPSSSKPDALNSVEHEKSSSSEEILRKIATFFEENEEGALALLRVHMRGSSIVDDRGGTTSIANFLKLHQSAYMKREQAATPHSISILQRELKGESRIGTRGGVPKRRARNLDEIERIRDASGPNREMFGKYKSDINPSE